MTNPLHRFYIPQKNCATQEFQFDFFSGIYQTAAGLMRGVVLVGETGLP